MCCNVPQARDGEGRYHSKDRTPGDEVHNLVISCMYEMVRRSLAQFSRPHTLASAVEQACIVHKAVEAEGADCLAAPRRKHERCGRCTDQAGRRDDPKR